VAKVGETMQCGLTADTWQKITTQLASEIIAINFGYLAVFAPTTPSYMIACGIIIKQKIQLAVHYSM